MNMTNKELKSKVMGLAHENKNNHMGKSRDRSISFYITSAQLTQSQNYAILDKEKWV